MSGTQSAQKLYKPDEILALADRLMRDKDILMYLKENPWSSCDEIASKLEISKRLASHKLTELRFYGLLQGRYKQIKEPTETASGLAELYFALADDFDARTQEVAKEVNLSRRKYAERHRKA
jgi:DNA-binding Lrp family transcriptional regulator